ncbi:MAG: peptide deformylase [Candidatus Magasanikbacteria bacterium]|nr:peptide deformylase [Candidatus Magasanikbacteria bacterium]
MSLLPIITFPHPFLRKKAEPIAEEQIGSWRPLVSDMIETMRRHDGVGLAAPQVEQSLRLAIISKEVVSDSKDWVLINPKIIKHSWRRASLEESCLSVPGIRKEVKRYVKIRVKARDKDGLAFNFEAKDFLARVIQHEIDHLDGILIVDK